MDGYGNDVTMMDGDAKDNMDIKITEVREGRQPEVDAHRQHDGVLMRLSDGRRTTTM